jgi:hypothetical protein
LQLTENGYTPDFEAELIASAEETRAAVANGTAKVYSSTAEMFDDWDKEKDGEQFAAEQGNTTRQLSFR